MDKDKIELVQNIGNEICEGCGPDRDCEEVLSECFRVISAIAFLDVYLEAAKGKDRELWTCLNCGLINLDDVDVCQKCEFTKPKP